MKERYFVINNYPGKNGIHSTCMGEFETHEEATQLAYVCAKNLIEITGVCDEEFIVFVGSKTKLDKILK